MVAVGQLAWVIYLLRMKKVVLAIIILLVGEARAEEKLGISGNDLLEFCQAGEPSLENPARAFCLGYIAGVLEGWHHATVMHRKIPSLCNTQRLTYRQLADMASIYLRDHPEIRPLNASSIIPLLFIDKLSCDPNQETNRKSRNGLELPRKPVDERKPSEDP
jgi:Rap1a immunity proteins